MVSMITEQTQPRGRPAEPRPRVLIADDEASVREVLCELLSGDYECRAVRSAEEALELLRKEEFALVLSDINMGGISGLDMLPRVRELAPDALVVMISAAHTIESAVRAMRAGAFDYVTKPFEIGHVEASVRRALEHRELLVAKRLHEAYLEGLLRLRTEELNHVSYHDALTGLPNRVLFEDRLTQALAREAEEGGACALLLLDLDHFRKINESLGYQVGDRLLREVGERLSDCAGESATVARFGGDEFALFVPRVAGPRDAVAVAYRIREAFRPAFGVNGHELYLTTSIGVSISPGDGGDAETLLRNAGSALHRARVHGPGLYEFYRAEMSAAAIKRLSLESDLRRALERGEIVSYYQPQFRIDEGGRVIVSGAESLARWQHPELGLVPPAEFIPLAEETGLIAPLGEQVLRAACAQGRAWQDAGLPPLRVAVNLSARQFRDRRLSETVVRALEGARLEPRWLELELTESAIARDHAHAASTLGALRELGVNIAVDDFGTGYSSLSHLIELPVNTLKIDRSFVIDATTNPKRAKLLKGVITLAHDLRLGVKAEGVETEEQREMLRLLGCDEMQGYLFGRPVPAADFEALLKGQ